MTRRSATRSPVSRLTRVLRVDAVGVGTLACLALSISVGGGRPERVRGLVNLVTVGLVGLGLAVGAVSLVASANHVAGRGARPHPDADTAPIISTARWLIVCGLVVNTFGTVTVIAQNRRDMSTAVAAAVLLGGGDVLSVLYLRHLPRGSANG